MQDFNVKNDRLNILATLFLKARSKNEIIRLLQDLFSNKELENLSLRAEIAFRLQKKESYEQIERETGASSATIAKVSEALKYGKEGLATSLSRIKRL